MSVELTAGKLRNLMCLSSDEGQFFMLAIDQRGSLQKALKETTGADPSAEDMALCKAAITGTLTPMATAVLTDPLYGIESSFGLVPRDVGILLAYEHSGANKAGPSGRELRSKLLDGWNVRRIGQAGANAVKLLLQYHPDASTETREHQENIARQVGEECAKEGLPFLLELTGYSLETDSVDTPQYARQKPDIVVRSAAEFSKPEYGVDVLKLEFPANLKFTREYAHGGVLDGKERQATYALRDVEGFCREVDDASTMPWVILSAAVNIEEFMLNAEMACAAGASGFLCGRAIWKNCIQHFPEGKNAMEEFLLDTGVFNFARAIAAATRALPWWDHRKFGGLDKIRVSSPGGGPSHEDVMAGKDQVKY